MKIKRMIMLIITVCLFMCVKPHGKSDEYYTIYPDNIGQTESIVFLNDNNEILQFHSETYLSIIFTDTVTGRYGFLDKESNSVHPAIYYRIYDLFCRDAAYPILVEIDPGSYRYIDRITGGDRINGQFKLFGKESEFRNGFSLIYIDSEISSFPSLIDIHGMTVSFPDGIIPIGSVQDNGLLIVSTIDEYGDAYYGICNTSGEIVFIPQFDYVGEYHNGYAFVRFGNKYGLIDEHGMICTNLCYELTNENDE